MQQRGVLHGEAPERLVQVRSKQHRTRRLEEGAEGALRGSVLGLRVRWREALLDVEGQAQVGEVLALEDGVAVRLQRGASERVDDVAVLAQLLQGRTDVVLVPDEKRPGEARAVVDEGQRVACTSQRRLLQRTGDVGVEQLAWPSATWSRLLWDGGARALAKRTWSTGDDVLGRGLGDLLPDGVDGRAAAMA